MKALLAYVTTPDMQTARNMAETLVKERLCACANIVDGMKSVYRWQGNIENADECIMLCKTTNIAYPAFEARTRELHPYDTPCIVAWPIELGWPPFMHWIDEETRS